MAHTKILIYWTCTYTYTRGKGKYISSSFFSSGHQKEMKETLRVYRLHKLRIRKEMFTVSLMASLALIIGNVVSHEGPEPASMDERRLPWTDWMDCAAPEAKTRDFDRVKVGTVFQSGLLLAPLTGTWHPWLRAEKRPLLDLGWCTERRDVAFTPDKKALWHWLWLL